MAKTKSVKLSALIQDFTFYPRVKVDSQHASYIAEAIRAGANVPPIIVDAGSMRIIDGFHRYKAHRSLAEPGEDPMITVELRAYKNEADMLRDAVRLNSSHGRALTSYDRQHTISLAEQRGVSLEAIAEELSITVDRAIMLRGGMARKHATVSPYEGTETSAGQRVPLKRGLGHFSGREMSEAQIEAQEHLMGISQIALVNQLILVVTRDLLDVDSPRLVAKLRQLRDLLDDLPALADDEHAA